MMLVTSGTALAVGSEPLLAYKQAGKCTFSLKSLPLGGGFVNTHAL